MNYNYCLFVGNAGRAPEIRTTNDGMTVASFSLAVSTWSREREGKGEPIWLRIVTFGKLAETIEKLVKKGSQVLVAGRLSVRDYTTKDGKEKTVVEIIAQSVEVQHAEKRQESVIDVNEVDRHRTEQRIAESDMTQAA